MSFNELIINGGFETGAFPPWIPYDAAITFDYKHSGFFSAILDAEAEDSFIFQVVPITPGERYVFWVSLSKIGPEPNPLVNVLIAYFDARFNLLGRGLLLSAYPDSLPNVEKNTWLELYETTEITPPGAAYAIVLIDIVVETGTADVVVDDISLLVAEGTGPAGPAGPAGVKSGLKNIYPYLHLCNLSIQCLDDGKDWRYVV